MSERIGRAELFEAANHATARAHEFDGGSVADKLAAFGLDMEDVRDLLADRWQVYEPHFEADEPLLLFVQGFLEGAITLLQFARTRRTDADT